MFYTACDPVYSFALCQVRARCNKQGEPSHFTALQGAPWSEMAVRNLFHQILRGRDREFVQSLQQATPTLLYTGYGGREGREGREGRGGKELHRYS